MTSFDFRPRTRVVFEEGGFKRLGEIARELGGTRCLLVADPGMVEEGYASEALRSLKARRMKVEVFHDFAANPTSAMVEAGAEVGRAFAADRGAPNLIVALGGGSSLDCAKGINFVLSNGGSIRDYWGYGKAKQPMLPMIAVPTTAGTGSEAQSYATITESGSGTKMACGDAKAAFLVALLDPKLTLSQPQELTAAAGYDVLAHALETLVTTRRTELSECFSRSSWRLINDGLERVLADPNDLDARGEVLLGAHFGGLAIENSNLGAAHALAYAITGNFGTPHGVAIALVLRHVVAWNARNTAVEARYEELFRADLFDRLRRLQEVAGLPASLRDAGIGEESLGRIAEDASAQWVAKFNPRPLDSDNALEILQEAF